MKKLLLLPALALINCTSAFSLQKDVSIGIYPESGNDHNTFENPDLAKPQTFTDAKIENGKLNIKLPAKSIVILEIK